MNPTSSATGASAHALNTGNVPAAASRLASNDNLSNFDGEPTFEIADIVADEWEEQFSGVAQCPVVIPRFLLPTF